MTEEDDGFGFDQDARNRARRQIEIEQATSPPLNPPFPYPAGPRFDPDWFAIPVVVPPDPE